MVKQLSLFFMDIVAIYILVFVDKGQNRFDKVKCPIHVHSNENKCHSEQIHIFIIYHVPLVCGHRLVNVNV